VLDLRLPGAVVVGGGAGLVLGDRHPERRAVDPDRPAVQQQRARRPQRLDQLPRRPGVEADHVDDGVGLERGDPRAEGARGILGLAVDAHAFDELPLGGRGVRLAITAA
jgi:hypothetical protein